MARGAPERTRIASAWALSVAAHAALIAGGAILVAQSLADRPPPLLVTPPAPLGEAVVEIDLPAMSDGSVAPEAPPAPEIAELSRGGGEGTPRLDQDPGGRTNDQIRIDDRCGL